MRFPPHQQAGVLDAQLNLTRNLLLLFRIFENPSAAEFPLRPDGPENQPEDPHVGKHFNWLT